MDHSLLVSVVEPDSSRKERPANLSFTQGGGISQSLKLLQAAGLFCPHLLHRVQRTDQDRASSSPSLMLLQKPGDGASWERLTSFRWTLLLRVKSFHVHSLGRGSIQASAEVYCHLLDFPRVDEEVVPLTLVQRVLRQSTVRGGSHCLSCGWRAWSHLKTSIEHRCPYCLKSAEQKVNRKGARTVPWGAPPHCRAGSVPLCLFVVQCPLCQVKFRCPSPICPSETLVMNASKKSGR